MKPITKRMLSAWTVLCAGAIVGFLICGWMIRNSYTPWVLSLTRWDLMVPLAIFAVALPRILLAVYGRRQKRKRDLVDLETLLKPNDGKSAT